MQANTFQRNVEAQSVRIKPEWHLKLLRVLYYLIMIVLVVFYMLPFWGTLTTSLKDATEVATSNPVAWPEHLTTSAYATAFEELRVPMLNSLIITLAGAFGSVALGSVCAYALSKWRFKFDNLFFILLVAATYLPYQVILIPLFQTIQGLGLYDTLWGLILVHTIFGMPMCTVMLRGFYSDVPNCLIRQAMIDGNGPWQIYRKVVLTNTKIATITVFVFQCTSIWNEMLFALILGGYDSMPATIALNNMMGTLSAEWNVQMAGSIWLALPVLLLYMFMGKYLIRGYMAGAVTAS